MNRKYNGLLIGLVCLLVCMSLCFTACGDKPEPEPSETAGTTTPTVETTEATVPATQETTVPTEETTAPTEETQPSGNDRPGGQGGYNPGVTQPTVPDATTPEETQPAVEVGQPGTETNAYYESVAELPGSFTTVKIPAKAAMYYLLDTAGEYLSVEDADCAIVLGENTYSPENGAVNVPLTGLEAPVALQVVNNGAEEKAFTVNVLGAVGSASNPEVITSVEQLQVSLAQDDTDGYSYVWTAERTGILLWGFDSVLPETANAELAVTVGEETMVLNSVDESILWAYVTEGDRVVIRLSAVADENGSCPAAEIAVSSLFVPHTVMEVTELPTTLETEVLPSGGIAYITLSGVANTTITIHDANAFVICNDITYGPDDFGDVRITIADNDTAELVIGNIGLTDTAFALEIAAGETGPQEVIIGEKNTASFGENDDDAQFVWTAFQDGTLKLTMDFDNYSGWYMQVTNLTTGEVSQPINSDGIDNYITMDVKTDDLLEILVNTHAFDSEITPAGDVSFQASFVSGTGTQEDPYSILGTDANIFVGAGQTVYCTGRFSGMNAEIYGENVTVENDGKTVVSEWGYASLPITGGDFFTPPVFTLTNTGADATYNVVMTYPLGSSANPEDMMVGATSTAILEANDADGYYFQYVSYVDGTLKITMDPENETEWFFAVENRTQGYFGEWHYSDSDPYVTSETVEVKAGDLVIVQVNTYNSQDMWDTPAGEVSFDSTFVSGTGTEEDPYSILGLDADLHLPEGQTVYCTGRFSGMFANVSGENITIVNDGKSATTEGGIAILEITGGDFFTPPVFTLTNNGKDADINVLMTYPLGSSENPDQLLTGTKVTAKLEADDENGYYYTFTSLEDGILTITMAADNKTGWFFAVENQTQGYFGDWHYSDSDPYVTSETIHVTSGDKVIVQVNTYNPENMWEHLAGEVSFSASFLTGSGTQEAPYMLQGLEADISVGAGETLYYTGRYSGMVLNLTGGNATVSCNGITGTSENGVTACPITGGDMWAPPVFTVTNNGEAAVFHISFTYPLGSMDNPEALTVGQHTVSFETASMEYYFLWKAPAAGTLTITIDSPSGWLYSVSNLTNYHYGDSHNSGDSTPVTSETLTVNAGDEIQLQLCTFNPYNPWEAPAGEVTFTVTFE